MESTKRKETLSPGTRVRVLTEAAVEACTFAYEASGRYTCPLTPAARAMCGAICLVVEHDLFCGALELVKAGGSESDSCRLPASACIWPEDALVSSFHKRSPQITPNATTVRVLPAAVVKSIILCTSSIGEHLSAKAEKLSARAEADAYECAVPPAEMAVDFVKDTRVVAEVHQSSPLLDTVHPGDALLYINGRSVAEHSLAERLARLAEKDDGKSSMMLVFGRPGYEESEAAAVEAKKEAAAAVASDNRHRQEPKYLFTDEKRAACGNDYVVRKHRVVDEQLELCVGDARLWFPTAACVFPERNDALAVVTRQPQPAIVPAAATAPSASEPEDLAASADAGSYGCEAPPGKLGVSFERGTRNIAVVHEHSPLLGKVHVGDTLLSINRRSVVDLSLAEALAVMVEADDGERPRTLVFRRAAPVTHAPVVVPEGCSPGAQLWYTLNGQQMLVTIPRGLCGSQAGSPARRVRPSTPLVLPRRQGLAPGEQFLVEMPAAPAGMDVFEPDDIQCDAPPGKLGLTFDITRAVEEIYPTSPLLGRVQVGDVLWSANGRSVAELSLEETLAVLAEEDESSRALVFRRPAYGKKMRPRPPRQDGQLERKLGRGKLGVGQLENHYEFIRPGTRVRVSDDIARDRVTRGQAYAVLRHDQLSEAVVLVVDAGNEWQKVRVPLYACARPGDSLTSGSTKNPEKVAPGTRVTILDERSVGPGRY